MMKIRIASVFLTIALLGALLFPASAESLYDLPQDKTLTAASAMVVHLGLTPEQDIVLYEKDPDVVRAPAALVRLMEAAYALTILEEKNMDMNTATGTYELWMFNQFVAGTGINPVGMEFGETWTIKDLLVASTISTASDAAVTLAAALSETGKVGDFVDGMNRLAKEIGCTHTSFANVTGLDALTQYTTARDMYKIIRYAMDFPAFESIVSAVDYTVRTVSGGPESHLVINSNAMLKSSSSYYYSPLVFGRTGFTDVAGWCLASLARDSGYDYMVIVLGCPNQDSEGNANTAHYADTRTLYKWAFNEFTYKPLLTKNEILANIKVNLAWSKDKVALVPRDEFATVVYSQLKSEDIIKKVELTVEEVDAPVEKGTVYGKVSLYINLDQKIGEVDLVAGESIEASQILILWDKVRGFLSSPWFYAGLGLVGALLVAYIILNIVHNRKRKKNNLKRVKKY